MDADPVPAVGGLRTLRRELRRAHQLPLHSRFLHLAAGALTWIVYPGGVNSIDLIQPDSMLVQPGQTLTITCRLSGYSVTDSCYGTGWIRQCEGKALEWIFYMWGGSGGTFYQNNALKNKFSYSKDMSAGTVTITGQNLQSEDTAVYYCVRRPTVTQATNRPAQKLSNQQPHAFLSGDSYFLTEKLHINIKQL